MNARFVVFRVMFIWVSFLFISTARADRTCEMVNPIAEFVITSVNTGAYIDFDQAGDEYCQQNYSSPTVLGHAIKDSVKQRIQPTKESPYNDMRVVCYRPPTNLQPNSPICPPLDVDGSCSGFDGSTRTMFVFHAGQPYCGGKNVGAWGCGGGDGYWRCPLVSYLNVEKKVAQCGVGNPVDPAVGRKFQQETDIRLPGGLSYSRLYISGSSVGAARAAFGTGTRIEFNNIDVSNGVNWRNSYSSQLLSINESQPSAFYARLFSNGSTYVPVDSYLYAIRASGQTHLFQETALGSGLWTSTEDMVDIFNRIPGGYLYKDMEKKRYEVYGGDSIYGRQLGRIVSLDGSFHLVRFDPNVNRMASIEDQFGRKITFNYGVNDRQIAGFTDPDGVIYSYSYTGNLLSSVVYPGGATKSYIYDEPNYSSAPGVGYLTGIQDENGSRFGVYLYGANGRAVSTENSGGVNKYSFTYTGSDNASFVGYAGASTTITDPLGTTRTVSFYPHYGALGSRSDFVSGSQAAGSGCGAAMQYRQVNDFGLLLSQIDFDGNMTCFSNDGVRRLELGRVEGYTSNDSCPVDVLAVDLGISSTLRKTRVEWHPNWDLKVHQAEPKKITTWVYNGQPDPTSGNTVLNCAPAAALLPDGSPIAVLCKQVEQGTTDTNGSAGFAATPEGTARVGSFTYNSYGQLLTAKDALNNLTTYSYYADTTVDHTIGDLQSITNAAGHVTQFTTYDRSGRIKRSVDPNGVVTTIAYTPRGWVNSVVVSPPTGGGAAQTTSYVYDGVGQLKEATLPDATKITYSYDGAHRLIGIKDGAGNTITYTLDNAGNRTAEALKDPAGLLARNVTRVFDALGRVQSMTGVQP
jgi:YD repeat-containing protein